MLDEQDIATANEIAKTLRNSDSEELVVVGNLLTALLAERQARETK